METTVTLYRPTGPKELQLVAESGYWAWPPRLSGQPIFYPVLNEEYATQIARDWNARDSSTGYRGFVTRFRVRQEFLARYEVHRVGGHVHDEYWIPAEDLDEFNRNIVGPIEVIAEYAGGPGQEPLKLMQQRGWYPFDEGQSIGHAGTENGIIMRDEEHGDGARITLERDGHTPFAITCGIYGWMFHTCFFSTEQAAQQAFEAMKQELARILALIPAETDPEAEEKATAVIDAIQAFVGEFA